MDLAPLNLADIQQAVPIVDMSGRPVGFFVTLTNQNNKNIKAAVTAINENIEATAAAQAAADAAQDSAIAAQADAIAGLAAAAAAQATANNAVAKGVGPNWDAPTGTADRGGFTTYTAPTISNPPTQAEVQALADALQANSRALKAVIDDLILNGAFPV
ncbi:hypothetical protein ACFSTI_29285 [Rhizorhabdus histidinilytica]|uniref:Uncharacterized protein n=1 Tax=Rhizorhabdus histidinilytica TaxID=439228 RepID=A0A1T5CGT7_9SPHN|nr:hypothetical protein [Rhizorhabdus histidinilytica]SKB58644.1 hypothetical protein SAMN06295920_10451 [Rhizorhabdus histidinilytica]